ncbi:MAG: hypothetical protein HY821_22060 [Acidobacteria bacterium]|nr:hypothetical protein [Acidobacteriota bacterium]
MRSHAPTAITRRDLLGGLMVSGAAAGESWLTPELPDPLIVEAYENAARQNVLAAVNPRVFDGYWSVCADGRGFGYGNTYPSLDGHQMTDALLWLGQVETVQANWAYVLTFQRADGNLPLAILPAQAGKTVGPAGYTAAIDANGGLYRHWVPGNPLAALAAPTLIQNADAIYRRTLDDSWLRAQMSAIQRAAQFLATLTTAEGAVRGGGYYVERPTRLDCDGVTQPHAVDAFRKAAALSRAVGDAEQNTVLEAQADRIRRHFVRNFWRGDRFAEYRHPQHGYITAHGYSDSDWAALAFGMAAKEQADRLWPAIRNEQKFNYGGMPTGIATEPEKYEAWEFSYPDRMDLAAMGRVWYLECAARARMGDADGLLASVRRVCEVGRANGYYWRERYGAKGGYGAEKYCEYPANLIRIVHRFLLGTELGLDGTVALAPVVPGEFAKRGFGQRLNWRGRVLEYRIRQGRISGSYTGPAPQKLMVRMGGERALTLRPGARFDVKI